jgi:2-hydroxychromene-2-carboxylate isomerase
MGELITLPEHPNARRSAGGRRRVARGRSAEFFFDLACPFTYLTAERVERRFDAVVWTPASAAALRRSRLGADAARTTRRAAERRAALLQVLLVWPERWPGDVPAAMRVAACAAAAGRGAAFVLAAARLAFCGGFDLGDPEILAEAAASAGLPLEDWLRAAGDASRDGATEAAGRRLLAAGADRLPAVRVGRALYIGEAGIAAATMGARVERR